MEFIQQGTQIFRDRAKGEKKINRMIKRESQLETTSLGGEGHCIKRQPTLPRFYESFLCQMQTNKQEIMEALDTMLPYSTDF